MSLPQIDTRSSLMRHSPSLIVGISTSMNSKSLGPTSCAAFIPFPSPVSMLSWLSVLPCAPETGYTIRYGWTLSTSAWRACWLGQQCAACLGLQPVDTGACGEEEDAPILAPGQIRRQLRQDNAPQQFSIGAAHPHTAWPSTEHIAVHVHLETIGHARIIRRHIQQDTTIGQRTIRTHVKGPDMLVGRIVDVQDRFVRGEGQAIRQRKVIHQ